MPESMLFAGDRKVGKSMTTRYERRLIDWTIPYIPLWIRSYHLTLATIPISILIIVSSFLAHSYSIQWLWITSFLILLQWVTDSLDGSLGKYRKEGLVRWGYYMDHFLDYIFLTSLLIGYTILLPSRFLYIQFFILVILSAYMVNSFLAFSATSEFRIVYLGIGPTEVRVIFIFLNIMLIVFGKTFLVGIIPYVLVLSFIGLCVVVYKTQRHIWSRDRSTNLDVVP